MEETINNGLQILGAFTLGYGVYLTIRYVVSKLKLNPLKTYIRRIVLEYLNELKQD